MHTSMVQHYWRLQMLTSNIFDVDARHLAVFSSLLGKAARHAEILYVHTVFLVQVHLAAAAACLSLSEVAMMGAAVSPVNQCHAERCIAD